jgi:two-component system chemotaxis response regulator CheY
MARILIADDAVITRANLKNILNNAGHTIVGEANNGQQAVALFDQLKPDWLP